MAETFANMYSWRKEKCRRGEKPTQRAIERRRQRARQLLIEDWAGKLEGATAGLRVVEAFCPVLSEWVNRRHGGLTYRLVQVLTGHGCFGEYLHKIVDREPTTVCHHCGAGRDTAQHTLEECPEWANQRRDLMDSVGEDLSLPTVVKKMTESEKAFEGMTSFCEGVRSLKEEAERERERDPDADPKRKGSRGRRGCRRRAYGRFP
ncbi:uncharacterized protein LOC114927926 [Nylanderia fulva]|uniref:uncharacterized protein LOC114927926 n=1 Tax=Nylanderia fulva TaxID=613905 RepID=UPI0010FAE490|nr:uncharacterized protein LOC114927926 [Nylanderia fulva]